MRYFYYKLIMVAFATKLMMLTVTQEGDNLRMIGELDLRGRLLKHTKTPSKEDDFDYIIERTLTCILEKEDGNVLSFDVLSFRSLNEVIDVEYMMH